ncbi:hypothetical protein BWI17_11640 [Betaproteobacteria bacterium GR16-43]|nr:hypothetical protein BWI17_11640 [Betaproteobacteria bacterium GR16-43]
MKKLLLAVLFAAANASAADQRLAKVELEQDLGGLDIVATATTGRVLILTLQNKSAELADCVATFEGGLATPVRRAAKVKPGKTVTLSVPVKDDVARWHIALTCKPK